MRLAIELRKLRERAGLTATEAARQLGASQTQISNIEAGRIGVSADRVRALARIYSCSDQALINALVGLLGDRKPGWWEQYRDILPAVLLEAAEIEHHATRLRTATMIHVPGLLQTVDHARALFRGVVPPLSPPEVEHRVSFRIKRQEIIYRKEPIPYTAVIHEAALRMGLGGVATSRAQLEHIIEVSERENVTVRVIPFGAAEFPATGHALDHVHGPVPQLDTVLIDINHGVEFLDAEAQLAKYRVVMDRMEASALTPAKSRDFIRRLGQSL
jgi:transcriptional regulator with XRE-family HTH domain